MYPYLDEAGFDYLRAGVTQCIENILNGLGIATEDFELNKYHSFAGDDEKHFKVVGTSRDLFPEDFNFPVQRFITQFEELLGFGLTDVNPKNGLQAHIILLINRPKSTDYNPPHKDIYETLDRDGYIPRYMNFWVPICGVNSKSSLPIVPGSHLLAEENLLRTFEGGVNEGNTYRVRTVAAWDSRNDLHRTGVAAGEALVFSSHLIHGCAFNDQDDDARVALEFTLFKK